MRLQALYDENFRIFSFDKRRRWGCAVDIFRQKVGITFSVHRHFPPSKSEKLE